MRGTDTEAEPQYHGCVNPLFHVIGWPDLGSYTPSPAGDVPAWASWFVRLLARPGSQDGQCRNRVQTPPGGAGGDMVLSNRARALVGFDVIENATRALAATSAPEVIRWRG